MAKGEKFIGLSNYLKDSDKDEVILTLSEIEKIIGDKLCKSAYKHKEYWYLSDTHTFPHSWIQEGYRLKSLDLNKKIAIFIKNTVNGEKNHIETTKIKEKSNNKIIEVETDIRETIIKYHYEIIKDENGRYKSWEHCHEYFIKNRCVYNEETIDIMCLHLAFYLASWGMYRGSSFLLQKDYKVHYEAVKEMIKPKYNVLWDIECEKLIKTENIKLLFEVSEKIKEIYIKKRANIDGRIDITDTLITKILMGIYGCAPAYDRFFIDGIKVKKVATGIFNTNSINSLIEFYLNNKDEFKKCSMEINKNGVKYPEMKLIDMYFWQIGFDISDEGKKKK